MNYSILTSHLCPAQHGPIEPCAAAIRRHFGLHGMALTGIPIMLTVCSIL